MKKILSIIFGILLCASSVFAGVTIDGVDDEMTCGTSNSVLPQSAAMTISAWIKPASAGEGNTGVIVSRDGGASAIQFEMATGNELRMQSGGATALLSISTGDVITYGSWQHVLVTWTGSLTATTVHLYVNNTEVTYATQTNGVTPNSNTGGTLRIGTNNGTTRVFDGSISQVAIYNVVVSAESRERLSKSRMAHMPLQVEPANLVRYYALDDKPDASAGNGAVFRDRNPGVLVLSGCTGDDGANNTGMAVIAEQVVTYP